MQRHISYLINDRDHGAAQLAAYVVQAFKDQLQPGGVAAAAAAAAAATPVSAATAGGPAPPDAAGTSRSSSHGGSAGTDGPGDDGRAGGNMIGGGTSPGQAVLEQLRDFGFHMAVCRPSMAAIANAAAAVLARLSQELAAISNIKQAAADGTAVADEAAAWGSAGTKERAAAAAAAAEAEGFIAAVTVEDVR